MAKLRRMETFDQVLESLRLLLLVNHGPYQIQAL